MERLCSKRDFRKSRTSTHPFVKKLTTVLTIEQFFFFEIRNYAMEWRQRKRRFFKLTSVRSQKQLPGGIL